MFLALLIFYLLTGLYIFSFVLVNYVKAKTDEEVFDINENLMPLTLFLALTAWPIGLYFGMRHRQKEGE